MIKLTIILIIVILVLLATLLILTLIGKLKYMNKKVVYAEGLIEDNIAKKIKLLIKLNAAIKKTLRAKKDYLCNLEDLESDSISNQEKDIKLSEYNQTITNLLVDYTKLSNSKDIKKQVSSLNELNEKNDATKTYFNECTLKLSNDIKKFPNNILSKFMKIKIIPLYETNETIKKINDDNL
ncbi:MAG: LemA family protein [Bacilli bacterium]|nr:LemA family protein [Bacilli bacterium]